MGPDAFYAEMQDEGRYEEECAGAQAEAEAECAELEDNQE